MSNLTTISGSNIEDLNGVKLAAGSISFRATDNMDQPISFQAGGGGQVLRRAITSPVIAGVITSFTVPDPGFTLPTGIYYRITVTDSSSGAEVLRYALVSFTGATFNFDNYFPTGVTAGAPLSGNSVTGNLGVTGNVAATGTVTGSNIAGGSIATGAGTTNKIPKYTNGPSAVIGDSSLLDNGTTVSTNESLTLLTPTSTLPATIANDTAGGINVTSNGGKTWEFANGGSLSSPTGAAIQFNGSTSGLVNVAAPAVAGANNLTLPAATDTLVAKNTTDILANKTFPGAGAAFNGSTSGSVTLKATATAGSNTATLPANTGTIAELNIAQTWSASQGFSAGITTSAGSLLTNYNGIATTGNGLASEVAAVDVTGQTANIGATTLYAVPATAATQYRVSAHSTLKSVGTTSTMPSLVITWTDKNNNTSQTFTAVPSNPNGNSLSGGTWVILTFAIPAKASTNITYSTTGYASTGTAMQYSLTVTVEAL